MTAILIRLFPTYGVVLSSSTMHLHLNPASPYLRAMFKATRCPHFVHGLDIHISWHFSAKANSAVNQMAAQLLKMATCFQIYKFHLVCTTPRLWHFASPLVSSFCLDDLHPNSHLWIPRRKSYHFSQNGKHCTVLHWTAGIHEKIGWLVLARTKHAQSIIRNTYLWKIPQDDAIILQSLKSTSDDDAVLPMKHH